MELIRRLRIAARFIFLVIGLIILSLLLPSLPAAASFQVEGGSVDLSDWKIDERPIVPLSGEWSFYWEELLEPRHFQGDAAAPDAEAVHVPRPWTSYRLNGRPLPNEGYATYRLMIRLPDDLEASRTLALYPKSIASAYRLWVNGSVKGGNGTVGMNRDSMKPSSYPKVIYFEPQPGWNELIIQVSNFSQRNAGIWQDMELGATDDISRLRTARVAIQLFVVGIFTIMAFYYVFVYFNYRREISALMLGLLCLSVAVRTVVLGESTALYLLPQLPWEWAVKAEYLSIAATALLLMLFINKEYPKDSTPWATRMAGIALFACMLFFLLTPARVYTYYLSPFTWGVLFPVLMYTMGVYILSAIRRRRGSLMNAIGFLFFTLFAVNDMLFYNDMLATDDLLSIGLLCFLVAQALNLSARFSRAMQESEQLSEKLQQYNRILERTVEERTQSLRQSNAQLSEANARMADIEQFRTRLLSNISHELNTPITSIKGFAKALRDGIITVDTHKYASRIYERSLLLERLIHDLIELTKLETKQVKFTMEERELVPFLQELFQQYEWEMEEQRIRYRSDFPLMANSMNARIDPIRMEQVFANLISNAIRHTPEGGIITVRARLIPCEESQWIAEVSVIDTGTGIPPSMHEHIFERFGQLQGQNAGKPHNGSGLGLAICREIMDYHQGEIGVRSGTPGGSEFYFRLPVYERMEKGATEA
ncbi:ATP-binding protein [Paenibacillus sp. J5C_2022]|uniref:ATP-binding protein n=1 Tax=Paenibacillus sp. J5C2022 TaxID=2977129 RepID=UPI0021D0CC57|nr:ATP-binding protein [Paenibacillus sp. J5C2022]MCU6708687.1 ATP-binding protein [Paenibacillus sp. J5C2022]